MPVYEFKCPTGHEFTRRQDAYVPPNSAKCPDHGLESPRNSATLPSLIRGATPSLQEKIATDYGLSEVPTLRGLREETERSLGQIQGISENLRSTVLKLF